MAFYADTQSVLRKVQVLNSKLSFVALPLGRPNCTCQKKSSFLAKVILVVEELQLILWK
jgi:hypothetical protein